MMTVALSLWIPEILDSEKLIIFSTVMGKLDAVGAQSVVARKRHIDSTS
jgi:hypothetical protein